MELVNVYSQISREYRCIFGINKKHLRMKQNDFKGGKLYDRKLLLKVVTNDNQRYIKSTLSEEQKKEKMAVVFETGPASGSTKVITREEHEAFLTMAYLSEARIQFSGVPDTPFQMYDVVIVPLEKLDPDFPYLYEYCIRLLKKRKWSDDAISSDYRIVKG